MGKSHIISMNMPRESLIESLFNNISMLRASSNLQFTAMKG